MWSRPAAAFPSGRPWTGCFSLAQSTTQFSACEEDPLILDGIGRRRFIQHCEVKDSPIITTICEFSIVSALSNLPHLRRLCKSQDNYDKDLSRELLKTASVVSTVTGGHGPYVARSRSTPVRSKFKAVSYTATQSTPDSLEVIAQ